jgi:hypothetical protein
LELGVSMLTRRERLERIAAAERDRRAGRIELAVASLGEGSEWPARVVLALALLPWDEGDETRRILQASLDTWATETGLAPLSVEPIDNALVESRRAEPASAVVEANALDAPIEAFELDEAFMQAEAQVDEMHDVNRVAERVLMEEPVDLTELSDEPVDAAWASASIWPTDGILREAVANDDLAESASGLSSAFDVTEDARVGDDGFDHEKASRAVALATLERWLMNLEKYSARRAQ